MMPASSTTNKIAEDAARRSLSTRSFLRAQIAPTTDSEGHDAIIVTLVINDLRSAPVSGDEAGDAILNVKQALQAAGENRSIIVDFATERELESDGGA